MRIPYRPRWPLLLTLAVGVTALTALAYLSSEGANEEGPETGGSYVEGVSGAPSRINPLYASFNEVDQDLVALVFAGLVRIGPKGEVQPDLAEDWKVTPDGLTYTFQLRRGLVWQDGAPLDARDVLFTYRAVQDPQFEGDPLVAAVFRDVTLEAPDPYTVVMTLRQPFSPFLAHTAMGVLPRHLLGTLDAAGLFEAPFNQQPVGSGPFRLTDFSADAATLEPFSSYHAGRPVLDGLELRFYREDASLLTALLNDEVDGALFRSGLEPDDIARIDGDSTWVRRSLHSTSYSLVYLNPQVPALRNANVRRALQLGLDREALIEAALGGQALPLDSPIVPDQWAYVGDPDAYRHDLDRAQELLDRAGWAMGDGGREKNGRPLQFTLASSDDPVRAAVAQEIARQWGELGIKVDVQASGASQFVEGVLLPRKFEGALVTIDPGADPDPYPFWHTSQIFGQGRNLAGFSNPYADRVLEDARQTPLAAKRAEDYRLFQEIFAAELPAVLLYAPLRQYVVRADLHEVKPGLLVTPSSRFYNVHRWYVGAPAAG